MVQIFAQLVSKKYDLKEADFSLSKKSSDKLDFFNVT